MDYLETMTLNRDLVLEFFLVLSRMEFALKVSGFATGTENSVTPDWDGYARKIGDTFSKEVSAELLEASNYYLNTPPQKQVLRNGGLAWSSTMPTNSAEIDVLLMLVRRVRNNLFHGGKYNAQARNETARNESLLRYGITILEASMTLVPKVKAAYSDAAI